MLGRFQRARRKVQARQTPYRAILGDANNNPYAGDGMYWVRPYDAANAQNIATPGTPYRVRAGSGLVVPRGGRVVWIGYGYDNRLTVLAFDHDDLQAAGIDPTSAQPNDPYREWIRLKNIQNFRALPVNTGSTPGMLVQVRQLFYYTVTGDMVRWNGTNPDTHIDLTSYVPGDGLQRYVVLWLRAYNPNGLSNIQVTASSTIDSVNDVLSFDELQECADAADPDTIPIQAFRLANAQTALKINDSIDVDLRQFINMPQVFGFPNTVARAYRVHEDFSVVAPSAITIEDGGVVQVQDNALLMILGEAEEASGGGSGGITQLTGDVTAGPGSGSQAATIANNAVTTNKILDANVTLAKLAPNAIAVNDTNATWGETVTIRQLVIRDQENGKWYKADTANPVTRLSRERGVVVDIGTGGGVLNTVGVVRLLGPVPGFSGLSITFDGQIFATSTPGGYTQTAPTVMHDSGQSAIIARFGYASSASIMVVDPSPIIYRAYESLADDEEFPVEHHDDPFQTRRINVRDITYNAFLAAGYDSSNQNADLQLQGQSGAGTTTTPDTVGAQTSALGDSGGNEIRVAQSMTFANTGVLTSATINAGPTTGTPSGFPTITLRPDSGGNPSATILDSTTLSSWTASASNAITFTGGVIVTSGVTYWLVAEMPTQATNNFFTVFRNNANPYANGLMKVDSSATPGTWAALAAGSDMRCSVTLAAAVANTALAQGFESNIVLVPYVSSMRLWLKKVGTPTDTLTINIKSDSGGSPDTTITNGASAAVAASTLGTSYGWIEFTWPVGLRPLLTLSAPYFIELVSSAVSASNSNYVVWGIDNTSPSYSDGVMKVFQSGAWAATSPASDGCFEVYTEAERYEEDMPLSQWTGGTWGYGVRRGSPGEGRDLNYTDIRNQSGGVKAMLMDVIVD